MRRTLTVAFAVLASAWRIDAQQVVGVVSDAVGTPVPGVLMQLLDLESHVVAQGLSGDRGAYRLRAPTAGTYTVRSLRIGYQPTRSPGVSLSNERDLTHDVTLTGLAIRLDTVRVSGGASCRIARDSALQSFRVLEQARAAIIAAGLPGASADLSTTSILFERTYDTVSARPLRERAEWWTGAIKEPWKTVSSDSLHVTGYIVSAADSVVYRAPGLDALGSEAFLDDHCFRLASSPDTNELGIAFAPTPARRKLPEIAGTLWVERSSAQLKKLTFQYVNAPLGQQERGAHGEMAFALVADAAWAITNWRIRMPSLALTRPWRLSRQRLTRAPPSVTVNGYREVGGVLVNISAATDTVWRHPPLSIGGRVADSAGRAVFGARVVVEAARQESRAGVDGRFRLRGVRPGDVDLEVHTAALDSLSTVVRTSAMVLDTMSDFDVRLPTPASIVHQMCGVSSSSIGQDAPGIALISLVMSDLPLILAHAKATIEWLSSDGTPHWVDARPDRDGVARFCGVPLRQTLILSASIDSIAAPTTQLRIPGDRRVVRTDMVLDPALKVGAILGGAVVRDSTNEPIPDAEVVFPELKKSQMTSERGLFRLRDLAPGTHRLIVRKMGFGALDTTISIRAGEAMERRIVLSRLTALAEVVVTASAAPGGALMREFEESRRIGLGHFLTRDDLAKLEGRKLESALAQMPGIRLLHAGGTATSAYISRPIIRSLSDAGKTWTLEGGGQTIGGCFAQVYLDNVRLFSGDPRDVVPDINRIDPGMLEAVEYYSSAAQTPVKYSGLNSTCGVLVMHSRRPR